MTGMPGEDHFNSVSGRMHIFGKLILMLIFVTRFSFVHAV